MANEARPCPCDIGDKFDYGGLGEEVQLEHIKAYLTKPSAETDKAVIVIQDIFGWELPNTRYMVDMLANNGYIAICPDFFAGKEPWSPTNDWAIFQDWLNARSPREVKREADAALKYLKEHCNAKRIAVVGFCWGGIVTHHMMLQYPELKAGVSVYGIIREDEGRHDLKNPTLFIFGENDTIIPLDQVSLLQNNLAKHCKVDFEVKIYSGQSHGFVHRKREDIIPADKPYIEEGRRDLINWLNKYM